MHEKNPKRATLKSSVCLNKQVLREEHDEAMNTTKDNGTTYTIVEIEKLHQNVDDKIGDVMKIGEEQNMLLEKTEGIETYF